MSSDGKNAALRALLDEAGMTNAGLGSAVVAAVLSPAAAPAGHRHRMRVHRPHFPEEDRYDGLSCSGTLDGTVARWSSCQDGTRVDGSSCWDRRSARRHSPNRRCSPSRCPLRRPPPALRTAVSGRSRHSEPNRGHPVPGPGYWLPGRCGAVAQAALGIRPVIEVSLDG